MTPLEIATAIVSVLLLLSRFVQAAKPAWRYLPKPVAVLLPPAVTLALPVMDLLREVKTWGDLVTQLIAATAMVLVGLAPKNAAKPAKHEPASPPPVV
jgi:hypothetical protein